VNIHKTQRPGWHTVTPRIIVAEPEALVGFLKATFGAQGEFRPRFPTELKIGDSVIMVSDGGGQRASTSAFLYIYVEDVDSTYGRALSANAVSVEPPAEMPYGDRRATVQDPWGNLWQIASYRSERQ
jgi:PhnB protein